MRILNPQQLEKWDLTWPENELGPWRLTVNDIESALKSNPSAKGVYWIGVSSMGTHAAFETRYCGKAVRQTLAQRLKQHAKCRGNAQIAIHLMNKKLSESEPLWFRFVEFSTIELAEFTEGTMISAFRDEYIWNNRNEFKQQWALELP